MNLTAIIPLIGLICNISGIPGLSLGVLYHGEVARFENFGYQDVAAQVPPDKDTIYVVASLSKAFSSALAGTLVEDGLLGWDTPVREHLPGYQRDEKDSAFNATVADILSHRTGIPGPDGYWMLSNGKVAFPRSDFVKVFNSFPTVRPIRTAFIYNNYAYELLGQIIEKVSGMSYGDFLRHKIMEPLGMSRTFDTRVPSIVANIAKPYAALQNRSAYELDMPLVRQDGLFSAAGGVRTSVSDLLIFYRALLDASTSQLPKHGTQHGRHTERIPNNPLKQLAAIWNAMISLPFSSLREHSYALGWTRAQLPSTFGLDGPQPWKPVVGAKPPCHLALYHQGIIQGYTSFTVLIPETQSAVVALANSGGLNEAGMLIVGAVLDTMFGTEIDAEAYTRLAKKGYAAAASRQGRVMRELEDGRKVREPTRPISEYVGRYYNALGNFMIEIRQDKDARGEGWVSFMGDDADTFKLVPYDADAFFWYLDHDDCVTRGRLPEYPAEYYIIRFVFEHGDATLRNPVLYWEYDEEGHSAEPFKRVQTFKDL
ncbi:beta-lactamase/transpeptidase-like protein [Lasiosphaeris hirsuta]|uniref:Beta-lactamase/transpeptidase-like protein n=1 Tax=Lasiosphaeris hirsuta TaxID=260670 RepID=A0AA40BDM4_9PEZI|nr:beta-lactamase/transpeptidase-like protein [Lasiosphaeris hirsuta]